MSNVLKVLDGREEEAEKLFIETLSECRNVFGSMDTITALTLNNLGLFYKQRMNFSEARKCYVECLDIRTEIFGRLHQDTIVAMHNLAELYIAEGWLL